jgi:hypothetical protein
LRILFVLLVWQYRVIHGLAKSFLWGVTTLCHTFCKKLLFLACAEIPAVDYAVETFYVCSIEGKSGIDDYWIGPYNQPRKNTIRNFVG